MESKPYLVIARKYRPQSFEDVVGQDHVTTTLKNAITLGRLGHAYLFTGPRGVGKTSMARILAKALNCKEGPTVQPCQKCQACVEIEGCRSLDVFEIDGASNRGIDEIRALRENVKFAPASGKFKIYILDEVHQITTDGFNALLKTLEEPPSHVKFIFATTAAHKVPATILSRCQRFDFKRIPTRLIADTLKQICKKEKIKADDEALFMIAKFADGGLRDSQSLLDQVAACADGAVAKEDVVRALGSLEEERLVELFDALIQKDAKGALLILHRVLEGGTDPSLFMEKLLEHVRNLLFLRVSESLQELVDATESYKKEILRQSQSFAREELFYGFSVISHTLQVMKRFEMKHIPLEMALVKLAARAPVEDASLILQKLKALEKKTKPAEKQGREIEKEKVSPEVKEEEADRDETSDVDELEDRDFSAKEVLREKKFLTVGAVWPSLLQALQGEKISVASYLAEGSPCGLDNGSFKIAFPDRLSFHRECLETVENRTLIEKHLSNLLEQRVRVVFESVKEEGGAASGPAAETPGEPEEPDGVVQKAIGLFGGRVIKP